MNLEAAAEIGKVCGEVQPGIRDWGNQDGSTFMRIRVQVNTSKPLCRGRKLRREDGEIGWIRFKYERLPIMCYWCGKLSHSDKDCEFWVRSNGSLTKSDRQFDAWLRAPLFNTKKCSAIQVGGEDEVNLKHGGSDQGAIGEVVEDTGCQSGNGNSLVIDRNCWQKEETCGPFPTNKETGAKSVTVIQGTEFNAARDSCRVTDFQETLRGIDEAISKYDNSGVDLKSNGQTSFLGQAEAHKTSTMLGKKGRALSEDEDMLPVKSPQGNDFKAHGWKRLVSDRPNAEVQNTPM